MDTDESTEEQVGEEPREACEPQCEMPKYKCHKEVHALEIAKITFDEDEARKEGRETTGEAIIVPADEGYAPFKVSAEYVVKHRPLAGGYYVVYEGGYKSWSPKEAFEKGYSKVV